MRKRIKKIILLNGLLLSIVLIPIVVIIFTTSTTIYPTRDGYVYYYNHEGYERVWVYDEDFYLHTCYYVSAEGEEYLYYHSFSFLEFIVPKNTKRADLKIWIRDFTLSYYNGHIKRFEMVCIVKCNNRTVGYINVNQWENLPYVDYRNISLTIPMDIHSINNTITIEPIIRSPQYYNITRHSEATVYFYSSNITIWGGKLNPYRPRLICYPI